MIWIFSGLLFWILLWLKLKFEIPDEYVRYTAVILLGLLDAIFWALRSELSDQTFNSVIFFSGLIFNAILAIFITFLWEILWLNLYLAATVVFTFRIFQNIWITRRVLLDKMLSKKAKMAKR